MTLKLLQGSGPETIKDVVAYDLRAKVGEPGVWSEYFEGQGFDPAPMTVSGASLMRGLGYSAVAESEKAGRAEWMIHTYMHHASGTVRWTRPDGSQAVYSFRL